MCDWIEGNLIISFPEDDPVAQNLMELIITRVIPDVTYNQSLSDRIQQVSQGSVRLRTLDYQVHLVDIPPQQEAWYITRIHAAYQDLLRQRALAVGRGVSMRLPTTLEFNVQPNHLLSAAFKFPSGRGATLVKSADFTFSNFHDQYKQMLGQLPNLTTTQAEQVRILILDTGLASDLDSSNFPLANAKMQNFVDHTSTNVDDDNGHGTVIARIIHSLINDAEILIYKVIDGDGRASEWDTLAALAADSGAHVINMSLEFGLKDRKKKALCNQCGRESQQSRSQVFQALIKRVADSNTHPVLIAAAGNDSNQEVSFPSRFSQVMAVSAITSTGDLSSFSNYGEYDDGSTSGAKVRHAHRFAMPGGEENAESIGTFSTQQNQEYYGTSEAAAYASGFVAIFLAQHGVQLLSNNTFWDSLVKKATYNGLQTSGLESSDYSKFGHGLLKF